MLSTSGESVEGLLSLLDANVEYRAEEIAELIGLKGSRTRQLLKELADKGKISFTAATKNRKYRKVRNS